MAGNQNAEQDNYERSARDIINYHWLYDRDTCNPNALAAGDKIDRELERRGTYRLKAQEYAQVLDWLGVSYSPREIAQFLIEKRSK